MKKLQDKVAVFVGGGSAVATIALKHFMDEGAKVLLVDALAKSCERSELTTYQVTVMRKFEIEDNIPVCGRRRARCRRRIFYAS